ncbi:MAG: hypothetical protein DRQ51_10560, partial [Gammaproteobacteria bacterium]
MKTINQQTKNILIQLLIVLIIIPVKTIAGIDTTAMVGTISGNFIVQQGAANYNVPLITPPGVAGLKPNISINYSNQTKNGILGMGFSIGGISTIHRCTSTIATDGSYNDRIEYNTNDKYCLDGKRLIAVNGTVAGDSNSEYRTEVDNFSKIIFDGNQWIIKTKTGKTMHYGNSENSQIEAEGKSEIRHWAISQIIDSSGNKIAYQYNKEPTEYTIKNIAYVNNSINFVYEDRADKILHYQAGSKITQNKRLKTISIFANDNPLRTYNLDYQNVGTQTKSQLISVEECTSNQCLPKTKFEYDAYEAEDAKPKTDINGDGIADTISIKHNSPMNHGGVIGRLSGSLIIDMELSNIDGSFQSHKSSIEIDYVVHSGDSYETVDTSLRYADINGDGLTDILFIYDKIYLAPGHGVYVLLSNGDGTFTNKHSHLLSGYGGVDNVGIGDVNGDGMSDLIYKNTLTYLSIGNGYFTNQKTKQKDWQKFRPQRGVFGDINGDGLVDSISASYNYAGRNIKIHSKLAKGDDSYDEHDSIFEFSTYIAGRVKGLVTSDINNDGLIDVTLSLSIGFCPPYCSNDVKIEAVSNGDGTFTAVNTDSKTLENASTTNLIKDISGDGLYHLKSITNGFGQKTKINYKSLTDSSVYTKGTDGTYPNIDTQNSSSVVSSVIVDNGTGTQNAITYKYGAAKQNQQGRGGLGFGWIETKNEQSGKITHTEYNQQFPHTGQVNKTSQYIEQNNNRKLIKEQTNTYGKNSIHAKVQMTFLNQSITKNYDLKSTNLLNTITTTMSDIDNYGNIGTTNKTIMGGSESHQKTTINTYQNNDSNWQIGKHLTTTTTQSHNLQFGDPITQTASFSYNQNGLLKTKTIEPHKPHALTTSYDYDNFGNIIKTTTTASDIQPISTIAEYSSDGKFIIKTTNSKGHSEIKSYDGKTGNLLKLTGPNQLATNWSYDNFGRKIQESRADETTTGISYQWATDEIPYSVYKIITTQANTPTKTTYYNKLNKEVRKSQTGFDGRDVFIDTIYDQLGRVHKTSLPYYENDDVYYHTKHYDEIGRVIKSIKPAPYGDEAITTYSYNDLTTTTTNAKGYNKTTIKNIKADIIRVDEPEGAYLIHQHNARGDLVKTDAGGVMITIEYDNRGNKIKMNDPDMGIWHYSYNSLNKLISQTDAKGQTTKIEYDTLGRMIKRD